MHRTLTPDQLHDRLSGIFAISLLKSVPVKGLSLDLTSMLQLELARLSSMEDVEAIRISKCPL
jgi:hypothetical protein